MSAAAVAIPVAATTAAGAVHTVQGHHLRPLPHHPYARRHRAPLGDPTPLACTVAKTALEVTLGLDGLEKLNRWVSTEVRLGLAKHQSLSRRAGYQVRGTVAIARVRVYRVSATAAEVSIVAREGDRIRAIAMRLQDVAGKWQATVIEIG